MSEVEKTFKNLKEKRLEIKELRSEIDRLQLEALLAIAHDLNLSEPVVEKFDPDSENALYDTLIINDNITARFDRFGTLTIYDKSQATPNSNYRGKVVSKVSLDTPEKAIEVINALIK